MQQPPFDEHEQYKRNKRGAEYFQAPEGYFEALPDRLAGHLGSQRNTMQAPPPEVRVLPLWQRAARVSVPVTAAVVLLLAGLFLFSRKQAREEAAKLNVSAARAHQLLRAELGQLDQAMLIDAYAASDRPLPSLAELTAAASGAQAAPQSQASTAKPPSGQPAPSSPPPHDSAARDLRQGLDSLLLAPPPSRRPDSSAPEDELLHELDQALLIEALDT
jgi:hypothetical protein